MKFFGRKRHSVPSEPSQQQDEVQPEAVVQIEEMKGSMKEMEQKILDQNSQMQNLMKQQCQQMNFIMESLDCKQDDDTPPVPIDVGSYECQHQGTVWQVSGVSSQEPDPDHAYFPGLDWCFTAPMGPTSDKIIATIIPCYNEEGKELERTLRGLSRQIMPEGWRVELVIVMDGVTHMSASMADLLHNLFGVRFANSDHPDDDPFQVLPSAETIIVHPLNKEAALTRRPVLARTIGGLSLVVKRENRRKANSQQWWLGPHATSIGCKYALATDCGTYFERTTVAKLIDRLDEEASTHAVTGYQRTMPANIQGDGDWEICNNPFHFLLRNLQRFEFEVDNVSFMSVYDTLGAMHVIPGPCGLYRYSKMGTLKDGLMHQYFRLFSRSNRGLILGNVELVEDRIPGTLLAFPPKKSSKEENTMPTEGWPKTGLVHDAIFYMEAEKPLSQLVKQRRRWLNGTFATYIWMLQNGIITNSNQDPISKFCSLCLVALSVFQGFVVRMCGPALLIVWMFRFGLFVPDLVSDPARIFDPDLSLVEVEQEPGRLLYGLLFGGVYMLMYVAFVIGHTPRAKPMHDDISIVRYSEPSRYKNDTVSAYRGWLFLPVLWINFIVVILYVLNAIGIVWTRGWADTPLVVRVLIAFCFLPFVAGTLDGLVRCNFSGLFSMLLSAPFAMPLMIWFTIWIPAYSTTRLSDLTWGNRERSSIDETETALKRAQNGERVAKFLIGFNSLVAVTVIGLMQLSGYVFPIFVMSFTLVLSATFVVSFADIFVRFISSFQREKHTIEEPEIEDTTDMQYKKMEDDGAETKGKGWCCHRRTGSDEGTTKTNDSDGSDGSTDSKLELTTVNQTAAIV